MSDRNRLMDFVRNRHSREELKRRIHEVKGTTPQQPGNGVKRIDSPLARYNDLGQITCVLCRSIVRSEAVWRVHLNSKQHKENIAATKQHNTLPNPKGTPPVTDVATKDVNLPLKRPSAPVPPTDSVQAKKPKGILKNSTSTAVQNGALPCDFFDGSETSSVIRKELVNIRLPEKLREQPVESSEQDQAGTDVATAAPSEEEKLPEGFFDDPKMDAKARNQEYKDPNDEEWDKFQKEIKEATNVSMAIISEEQEESTAERQIAEIDEQIRNWSRVLSLEKKKEQVQTMRGPSASTRGQAKENGSTAPAGSNDGADEDDEDDEAEFNEFLDWRAKKSYK